MPQRLLLTLLAVCSSLALSAQGNSSEPADSVVSLLSAQSMELIDDNGTPLRKVTGPARFLHNNTYLICDTALWNVNAEVLYCMGNVKLLQEETVLTSDRLTYLIDQDLAQFRGSVVQLEDKDHNVLRTSFLDYNTADSVAVFHAGGAMKDSEGQIIESQDGTYDSKTKIFTFERDVEMFTDSVFVSTTVLTYFGESNLAVFGNGTNAWKDEDMLSAEAGTYDRNSDTFFFRKDVHGISGDKEQWSDTLYFYRSISDVEMRGKVQITDTLRRLTALGGHIYYTDSTATLTMRRDPAVLGQTSDEGEQPDTVWFAADSIIYRTVPMCDVPEGTIEASATRAKDMDSDAVTAYRRKAAEAAAKAAAEAEKQNNPNTPPDQKKPQGAAPEGEMGEGGPSEEVEPEERTGTEEIDAQLAKLKEQMAEARKRYEKAKADSIAAAERAAQAALEAAERGEGEADDEDMEEEPEPDEDELEDSSDEDEEGSSSIDKADEEEFEPTDSLSAGPDSLEIEDLVPKDSTKVNFATALGHVRVFRYDMQMRCDSLEFCDLDSLMRLYKNPFVWDNITRQYTADSIIARTKDSRLEKASLMSSAYVIVQEDTLLFDQIRSTEMMAYFDTTSHLARYDALGEADGIFFIKEDSVYATVNKFTAKMMSARFKDGDLDYVYYFDSATSDVYPLAQLRPEERVLKGFNWLPDDRPKNKYAITTQKLRRNDMERYRSIPRPEFVETDLYFPGFIEGVYEGLEQSKVDKELRRQQRAADKARADSLARVDSLFLADSLLRVQRDSIALADSLFRADSLATADSLAVADSLARAVADSLQAMKDSISLANPEPTPVLDEKAIKKAEKRAEQERKAAERQAAMEARIAKREAKWARLDSLDAAKLQAKQQKALEKQRNKKLQALLKSDAQDAVDSAKLERYLDKYEKKKAKLDAKVAKKEAIAAAKAAARKSSEEDDDDGDVAPSDDGAIPGSEDKGAPDEIPDDNPPEEEAPEIISENDLKFA